MASGLLRRVTSGTALPTTAAHHDDDLMTLAPEVRAVHADRVRARRAGMADVEPGGELVMLASRRGGRHLSGTVEGDASAAGASSPFLSYIVAVTLPRASLTPKPKEAFTPGGALWVYCLTIFP